MNFVRPGAAARAVVCALLLGAVGSVPALAETWASYESRSYWLHTAPCSPPMDEAEVIVTGVVASDAIPVDCPAGVSPAFARSEWRKTSVVVDAVVKGEVPRPGQAEVVFPTPASFGGGSFPYTAPFGKRALLFLAPSPDETGLFILCQPGGPKPMPPPLLLAPQAAPLPPDPSMWDRLVAEFAAASRMDDSEIAVPAVCALGYLAAWCGNTAAADHMLDLLTIGSQEVVLWAVRAMMWGPTTDERILPVLRELRSQADSQMAAAAYAALLAMGQRDMLEEALAWAGAQPDDSLSARAVYAACGSKRLLTDAGTARRVTDAAIASGSPVAEVAVSRTLRDLASEDLVPVLALLLEAGDREAQYHAIMGLWKAAGTSRNALLKGLAPNTDAFRADPEHYVARWREWLEAGRPFEPYRDKYGDPIWEPPAKPEGEEQ